VLLLSLCDSGFRGFVVSLLRRTNKHHLAHVILIVVIIVLLSRIEARGIGFSIDLRLNLVSIQEKGYYPVHNKEWMYSEVLLHGDSSLCILVSCVEIE